MFNLTELPLWAFFFQLSQLDDKLPDENYLISKFRNIHISEDTNKYIIIKNDENVYFIYDLNTDLVSRVEEIDIAELLTKETFIAMNFSIPPRNNLTVLQLSEKATQIAFERVNLLCSRTAVTT